MKKQYEISIPKMGKHKYIFKKVPYDIAKNLT